MWQINNKEVSDTIMSEYVAFVYKITNLKSGKMYIGKKKLKFYKSKKVKGRINKKRIEFESDWKTYYGSNQELNDDIKNLGEEHFKREIVRLCKTLSEASYLETKYIFESDALLYPDRWYNSWVSCRINRNTLKIK